MGEIIGTPNLKIYLKETYDFAFGPGALDWNTVVSGATLVYDSNPVTATSGIPGWKQFLLSSNYTYTGNNLILLTEYVNTGNTSFTSWEVQGPLCGTVDGTTKYVSTTDGTLENLLISSDNRRPLVAFDFLVDCYPPIDIVISDITATEATVSWTIGGNETIWEYAVQSQGMGIPVNFSSTEVTTLNLGDLNPVSYYEFYIRATCGAEGESFWKGPYNFTTSCAPVNTFFENFDSYPIGSIVPNCWDRIVSNPIAQHIVDTTPIASGDRHIRQLAINASMSSVVILPEVTNINTGTHWLRFKARVGSGIGNLQVGYIIDITDSETFTEIELLTITNSTYDSSESEYTVIFPETVPIDARIAIRNPGTSNVQHFWDDVSWELIPSCLLPPPVSLEADINQTTANLSWSNDGDLFDIEYGIAGFIQGTGIMIAGITTNSYTLEDLILDTNYEYYVRRYCSDGEPGYWTAPYLFRIGYCEAFSGYPTNNYYISSFSVGESFIPYSFSNSSGPTPNGYNDYTGLFIEHFANEPVQFTVEVSGTLMGVNIWVDWNNNFEFEESEKVYASGGTGEIITGNFFIPEWVPSGSYRLRVRGISFESNPSPCGIFNGEAEDYTFTVIDPPSCLPPFTPTVTNISSTSVLLAWQSNGNVFDIEYGENGFTPGTGTIISGVSNPYVLGPLTAGVTYNYYVRTDCSADNGGYSIWNGPVTFTSGVYQGMPTLFNQNPQVEDISCAYESITIDVPEGQFLAGLTVDYIMTSASPALDSHQRSVLYSSTLGMGETQVALPPDPQDYPGVIYYSRSVDFANGTTGTIEFELKAWRTAGGTGCGASLVYVEDGSWVLNPTFEDIPTCPNPPMDLGYTNITTDSVDLIWNSDESGTFQVKWGTIGFNVETAGTVISDIEAYSYTLSELDSTIPYDFYVRRDCSDADEEDFGEWVGPLRFNSGHCIPYATQGNYFTLFNTTNAVENVTYSFPVGSPLGSGYVNTDMIITESAGETFNFTSNYIGGASGLKIWVDWNNNFVFEEDEEVYFLANTNGNKSGAITVPAGTQPGDYRMRARAQQGATANPNACGLIVQGEALDFTLRVPCDAIDAPTGDTVQYFTEGDTLAHLDVTGTGIVWYADEDLENELEETELLVHGTTYYVISTVGDCQSEALTVTVEDICFDFDAPTGDAVQYFTEGDTLAHLDVTGTGLMWYVDEDLTMSLDETELLVHGTTYYVVNTNDNCQSEALTVTVEDICFDFDAPTGDAVQYFTEGDTLAHLDVTGTGLMWYVDEDLTMSLDETELLVHGTTYYVVNTNDNCQSEALAVTVEDICFDFDAPTGNPIQQFTTGDTLADLDVTGTGLVWYADEDLTIVLDEDTQLVDNTTYYVVSTNEDCQSEALAIMVEEELSVTDFNSFGFTYYPNPVSELLYLSANTPISDVTVINMLGQQVNVSANHDNTRLDMSGLPTGNYLMKVTIEGVSKNLKIVKN